ALSSNEDPTLSTKFLKRGANDYLKKPFSEDEIQIRVNTNLEMFHLLRNASDLANRDYLTNAYNRRYFFESGNAILKKAIRNKKSLFLAILDIDHFKQINDTFGHDIGDEALKYFSKKLNESFRTSDLIARFGGEEFCVLLEDISQEKAIELLDNFRKYFENHTLNAGPHEIHFTISIGIFYGLLDDLGDMIKEADMGLYRAKESGRNKIILNDESIV
ncbi:MAG: diguanylate cyclase, partial [Thiovulaceae bacterium]|nr:diguanylate cyclase [Sulfurimonadaceae bacterium]